MNDSIKQQVLDALREADEAIQRGDVRKDLTAVKKVRAAIAALEAEQAPATLPERQRTAPERIYLHDGHDDHTEPFPPDNTGDGVTWSSDNATGAGVPYVRADLALQAPATQAAEPRCWLYTNNSGVQVIHWHSGTPIFLADQAAAQKWTSTHRLEPLYAHPPVAQPLSEREIVACLAAAGCFGTVRMSYETGPYDIDRTTVNSDKLATELQRAFCAKNGITLAGKEKP